MERSFAGNLIYVIPADPASESHILYALDALGALVERRIVVCTAEFADRARALQAEGRLELVLEMDPGRASIGLGYKRGLDWLWAAGGPAGQTILTGSHVIGPILPLEPRALDLAAQGAGLFSCYWHEPAAAFRQPRAKEHDWSPSLDFVILSADLMRNAKFRALWGSLRADPRGQADADALGPALGALVKSLGLRVLFPEGQRHLETPDPRLSEIDKLVAGGVPCLPIAVLRLDPLLHDLKGINLRRALDGLRQSQPAIYHLATEFVARNVPPRDFAMAADQVEVLPLSANAPDKTEWSFGRIAVFIHAYYAEMMPEFAEVLGRIPCAYDLYVTTSSAADRDRIDAYLSGIGLPEAARQVVVVRQNRGRDMSSLFITFREVALSGRYKVALRLHSKRTPQVSRQVGEGFKEHLFENLAASRGYISNILDRFEAEPDIGMIMPPVVHIGFGTLGHAWFNNFSPLSDLADDMGLKVKLDEDTPLAPLGTMYWFKPDALFKMFDWPWAFEDYNPEPRHVDGGLAHVQERLLCYVCIDRGYRVVMALTPAQAGRNYAKLEYKLQLLAARLASGNVHFQRDQLDQLRFSTRSWLLRRLMLAYADIIRAFPASRRLLRPIGHAVRRILNPRT